MYTDFIINATAACMAVVIVGIDLIAVVALWVWLTRGDRLR
jgi:hypothetical protein